MRRSAAIALALLAASATPAAAQSVAMVDSKPSLAWRAPAGCPDAASLRARVEQRLERSLDDVVIGVEVDVVLTAGRYVARVDLRAMTVANDVRTLKSNQCSELADAVAVIVTRVASEAIAKRRVAVRESEPATMIVASVPPPAQLRPWVIGGRVSAVSGIGVIPKVGLAVELAVTARRDDLLLEVAGTRWLDSMSQLHDGAPAAVDVALDVACARVGWRPKQLPIRAWSTVEVGMMGGQGVKLPVDQVDSGRWIAAGAGFGVAWQITKRLRLIGTNETMLALDRARFTQGDGIVVYAPSPVSFRASAGIEVGWQ